MFTGLVETTGRVRSLDRLGEQARLSLAIPFAAELSMGESVAVNGWLTANRRVSVGKYASTARPFTTILPEPLVIRTRATADLRRPVPRNAFVLGSAIKRETNA